MSSRRRVVYGVKIVYGEETSRQHKAAGGYGGSSGIQQRVLLHITCEWRTIARGQARSIGVTGICVRQQRIMVIHIQDMAAQGSPSPAGYAKICYAIRQQRYSSKISSVAKAIYTLTR